MRLVDGGAADAPGLLACRAHGLLVGSDLEVPGLGPDAGDRIDVRADDVAD